MIPINNENGINLIYDTIMNEVIRSVRLYLMETDGSTATYQLSHTTNDNCVFPFVQTCGIRFLVKITLHLVTLIGVDQIIIDHSETKNCSKCGQIEIAVTRIKIGI